MEPLNPHEIDLLLELVNEAWASALVAGMFDMAVEFKRVELKLLQQKGGGGE